MSGSRRARMRRGWRKALGAAAGLAVSGCAVKDLKAPCAPDEGAPVAAYAEAPPTPAPFGDTNRCGALRPLNRIDAGAGDGGLHGGE